MTLIDIGLLTYQIEYKAYNLFWNFCPLAMQNYSWWLSQSMITMCITGKVGLILEVLLFLVLLTKLLSCNLRGLEALSSVIQIPQGRAKKKYSHIQDIIYSSVFIAICLELIHWKAAVGLCLVIREKPHFKITFIKRNKEHTSLGPQQFMPKLSC